MKTMNNSNTEITYIEYVLQLVKVGMTSAYLPTLQKRLSFTS